MGVQRKLGKVLARIAILVHIAPHQQGVQRHEREPMLTLIDRVGRRGQRRGHRAAETIGHLFHAAGHHEIAQAAGDGHIAQAHRRAARSASRFDLERLDAAHAGVISDQCAHILLMRKLARQHIADHTAPREAQSPHRPKRPIRHPSPNTQGFVPMLANRRQSNADDANVSQS